MLVFTSDLLFVYTQLEKESFSWKATPPGKTTESVCALRVPGLLRQLGGATSTDPKCSFQLRVFLQS